MNTSEDLAKEILEASVKTDRLTGRSIHLSFNDSLRIAEALIAAGWTPPGHAEGAGELPAPTP